MSRRRARDPKAWWWANTDASAGPDACWTWTGRTNRAGYGILHVAGRGTIPAHRYALELAGDWLEPDGRREHVHHRCGRKTCVNPAHLQRVTPAEHRRIHEQIDAERRRIADRRTRSIDSLSTGQDPARAQAPAGETTID